MLPFINKTAPSFQDRTLAIHNVCRSIICQNQAQIEQNYIIECVVSSVAIYFNQDKQEICNFKRRGIFSDLRGICYFILKRRGFEYTHRKIAHHFGTHPSKVCELCQRVRERIALNLYNYDNAVAIIEQTINTILNENNSYGRYKH